MTEGQHVRHFCRKFKKLWIWNRSRESMRFVFESEPTTEFGSRCFQNISRFLTDLFSVAESIFRPLRFRSVGAPRSFSLPLRPGRLLTVPVPKRIPSWWRSVAESSTAVRKYRRKTEKPSVSTVGNCRGFSTVSSRAVEYAPDVDVGPPETRAGRGPERTYARRPAGNGRGRARNDTHGPRSIEATGRNPNA